MTPADQEPDGPKDLQALPLRAQFIGHIAIASGGAGAPAALEYIRGHAELIRDSAADLADELNCGPEAVEAVRQGLNRLASFRACKGLEGNA